MLLSPLSNTNPPHSLLWITDPWSTLDEKKDTTLRLAHEAQNLGIRCWWSSPEILLGADRNRLRVIPFEHAPNPAFAEDLPPSKFFQIHFRVDPPVNDSYRNLIRNMELRIQGQTRILNPPELVTRHSEKLPPAELLDLAPDHHVISGPGDIPLAHEKTCRWGAWISKPMNLAQSQGVRRWERSKVGPEGLQYFREIVEAELCARGGPILVEEYLPGIAAGEVRLWFAGGALLGALKKHPLPGDFRVLIDAGSRIEAHSLSPEEARIAGRITQALRRQGAALAAIDLIDGKICDYNITSPGLLVQLEEVHGKNFAKTAIELLLAFPGE